MNSVFKNNITADCKNRGNEIGDAPIEFSVFLFMKIKLSGRKAGGAWAFTILGEEFIADQINWRLIRLTTACSGMFWFLPARRDKDEL
jgi:hypothetical protein